MLALSQSAQGREEKTERCAMLRDCRQQREHCLEVPPFSDSTQYVDIRESYSQNSVQSLSTPDVRTEAGNGQKA